MEAQITSGCHGDRDSGSNRPWSCCMWHKYSWGRLPLATTIEQLSRWPTTWRTIISKKFLHCCKSSRAHNRFPRLGIWQRDQEAPRIWLWRPVGFYYRISTRLGNRLLEGTNKTLCTTGARRKEQWPHKRLSWLACKCLLWGQGPWIQQYWEEWCWHKTFWRGNYQHYPYHSLASGQTTGREHSPTHQ